MCTTVHEKYVTTECVAVKTFLFFKESVMTTTNLGELLRAKLEANKKAEEKKFSGEYMDTLVNVDDQGVSRVAVLVSDDYGGWFTRHGVLAAVYDPQVVLWVQDKCRNVDRDYDRLGWSAEEKAAWAEKVIDYCARVHWAYDEFADVNDAELCQRNRERNREMYQYALNLRVEWVRVGTEFIIDSDGNYEFLLFREIMDQRWLTAGKQKDAAK